MTFRAPWGRDVTILTGLGLFTVGLPLGLAIWRGRPLFVIALLTTILATAASLCVRGYEVVPGELRIRRLLWSTRWPLDPSTRATIRPDAMRGSWRTWGNGGLFAVSGHFSGSGLGRYRAFVTDAARTVVLETRRGIVVVSPERPAEFSAAIADAARQAS